MALTVEATTLSYYQAFDTMGRRMRDKGWYQLKFPKFLTTVPILIAYGVSRGDALEIGPGHGYLGLEWLKSTSNTTLTGLDVSAGMVEMAERNAAEYEFKDRVRYRLGDAGNMPFSDGQFDCVFSSASLHEWTSPRQVLEEIARVLKSGGIYYITDLRRDMSSISKWVVWFIAWPRELRPYFIESVSKSYTIEEVKNILRDTPLGEPSIFKTWFGLTINGAKREQ